MPFSFSFKYTILLLQDYDNQVKFLSFSCHKGTRTSSCLFRASVNRVLDNDHSMQLCCIKCPFPDGKLTAMVLPEGILTPEESEPPSLNSSIVLSTCRADFAISPRPLLCLSSSPMTVKGTTMSCSPNLKSEVGSWISTLVSNTNVFFTGISPFTLYL